MSKNNFTNNATLMQNYRTTRYTHVYDKELNRWRLGLLEVPEDTNIRPAVSNPIADLSVYEDSPFYFQFPENVFTDDNPDDVLTYTATQQNGQLLPAWLTFNPTTREFSGTPSNDDVAVLSIKVVATDSNRANIADVFDLTVINTNDSPMLSDPILDQTIPEDSTISFTIPITTFVELDQGDVLTYTATLSDGSPLPAWLTFDSLTRNFSASPTNDNVGVNGISLTATDLFGASATNAFTLVVTNVNDAPFVFGSLTNQTLSRSLSNADSLSYQFPSNTFSDEDLIHGDVLTYSASGLPSGITLDSNSRTFSGTPEAAGSYNVTVTATDTDGATASLSFNIEVEETYDASTAPDASVINEQHALQEVVLSDYVSPGATFIIPSGFWLWSGSTSTPAIIADVANVTIKNYGNIIGKGGSAGVAGGDAISVTANGVTIENNAGAFIAGGGGGGGGSQGGGGAGQAAPGQAGAAGGAYTTSTTLSASVSPYGCSEGGSMSGTISCSVTISGVRGAGGQQGASAGSGTTSGGSCRGSGVLTNSFGCSPMSYGATLSGGGGALNPGGQGGSILSATQNQTVSGGGWGLAGASGGGAGGAAISGTYASLTNNGTVYGSV